MVRKSGTSGTKSSKSKGVSARKADKTIARDATSGQIKAKRNSASRKNKTMIEELSAAFMTSFPVEKAKYIGRSAPIAKRLGFEDVVQPAPKAEAPLEIVATLPPMHPGEVLRDEFLEPMGLSAGRVAKACKVPRTRIERIAAEETAITADTALRLGRFFGMDPRFWLNLQDRYDLEVAKADAGKEIEEIEPYQAAHHAA